MPGITLMLLELRNILSYSRGYVAVSIRRIVIRMKIKQTLPDKSRPKLIGQTQPDESPPRLIGGYWYHQI